VSERTPAAAQRPVKVLLLLLILVSAVHCPFDVLCSLFSFLLNIASVRRQVDPMRLLNELMPADLVVRDLKKVVVEGILPDIVSACDVRDTTLRLVRRQLLDQLEEYKRLRQLPALSEQGCAQCRRSVLHAAGTAQVCALCFAAQSLLSPTSFVFLFPPSLSLSLSLSDGLSSGAGRSCSGSTRMRPLVSR
jgi:hypothetical protein